MGYKTLLFSNPCKLRVKSFQLACKFQETEDEISIPLEDISTIVLENMQIENKAVLRRTASLNREPLAAALSNTPLKRLAHVPYRESFSDNLRHQAVLSRVLELIIAMNLTLLILLKI